MSSSGRADASPSSSRSRLSSTAPVARRRWNVRGCSVLAAMVRTASLTASSELASGEPGS
ncbi:hypothetical protein E1265_29090 [Streptomyces sp. 8K308]|uniref:hypothetical protein n=1 Tax=Streptomyces sp. 8K308 TaxID=2530388 RepID=UPI0010475477|nr:hypothetical protein [Streptomyces sp. 8K308]TDC12855.1 hypothetical protein E1265_29090 [Streptomyces sp. 8K308]